jgi:hypothetical protein
MAVRMPALRAGCKHKLLVKIFQGRFSPLTGWREKHSEFQNRISGALIDIGTE